MSKKFGFDLGLSDDDEAIDGDLTKQIENIDLRGGRRPTRQAADPHASTISDINDDPYARNSVATTNIIKTNSE